MFNLFRKIPKGYVETVDGYLIKESEAKKIVVEDWYGINESKIEWYRKENAPNYALIQRGLVIEEFYKMTEVDKNGTPIGYHTQEEVQKLKDRIKELEDKYELTSGAGIMLCGVGATDYTIADSGCTLNNSATKNKRGRPKKK